MEILLIDDAPSQEFTYSIDDVRLDMRFAYNQIADRWSVSIWREGSDCPLIAGRFLTVGVDLLTGLGFDSVIVPLDRPGIAVSRLNWYSRVTGALGDNIPATFLLVATAAEIEGMFAADRSLVC